MMHDAYVSLLFGLVLRSPFACLTAFLYLHTFASFQKVASRRRHTDFMVHLYTCTCFSTVFLTRSNSGNVGLCSGTALKVIVQFAVVRCLRRFYDAPAVLFPLYDS